jgi:polysaccharide deacetylase 2 family uncharacterized protein YibQ
MVGEAQDPSQGLAPGEAELLAEGQALSRKLGGTGPGGGSGGAAATSGAGASRAAGQGGATTAPGAARPYGEGASLKRPVSPPLPKGARLIIVIDDVGYNLAQLEAFLKLPFPLTFAVLPGLPSSAKAAQMIRAAGKELILHQPMESLGGSDPGPDAVYLDSSPEEAAAIVSRNLDSLPGAVGMNNHEGSAVSQDGRLMGAILAVAKSRGIYYLDSLTTPDPATPVAALQARFRYWERDVFLDNSPDRVSIIHYIEVGKKKAEKNGAAVMIGHVWSAELAQTLTELYPTLIEEGFSLSTISKVMLEEADAHPGD